MKNTAPSWCQGQLWSATWKSTSCQWELFSETTEAPHSDYASVQRVGGKPLLLPASTLCCSLRELESQGLLCKLASDYRTRPLLGCRLWFMSLSGMSLLYLGLPASLIGTLNTLISACLLGLLKHNARAHSSLEVTVRSGEVSGS